MVKLKLLLKVEAKIHVSSGGRASNFRASGGLEPSVFCNVRVSSGLGYLDFGLGRALHLQIGLRAGIEPLSEFKFSAIRSDVMWQCAFEKIQEKKIDFSL